MTFKFNLPSTPWIVTIVTIVLIAVVAFGFYTIVRPRSHDTPVETWASDVKAYLNAHTVTDRSEEIQAGTRGGAGDGEHSVTEPRVELKDPEEYYALAQLYHHGKFGKPKNTELASENYHECIRRANNTTLAGKCYIALAQMYETGVPEGTASVDDVIDNYLLALECGYEECIVHIGKIYLNGMHPYVLPEKMVAARIFSSFSRFSHTVEPWCKLHLQEIHGVQYKDLDAVPSAGVRYAPLPFDILDRMQGACSQMRGPVIPYTSSFNRSLLRDYDAEDRAARGAVSPGRSQKRHKKTQSVLLQLPQQTVKNDTQNVHDHSVQNIGNQIIDTLESQVNASPNDFSSNKQAIMSHVDETKYPHVRRVCDSLNPNFVHSRFNKSEADVFNLMWTKVKNEPDKRDIFIDSLNSGVEHGHVVCSTGKIMRMLSALDATDDSIPDLKPDWVVRQEILAVISNTIDNLTKTEKRQYDSDNNEPIKTVIGDRVRHKCRADYEGVLAPALLDMHLNEYLEYI